MARIGAAQRLGRWSAGHPWRAVGVWALMVVMAVGLGSAISTHQTKDADYRVGQSGRAAAMIAAAGLDAPDQEYVLIGSPRGALDRPVALRAASDVRDRLATQPVVASVAPPVLSKDGTALLLAATVRGRDADVRGIAQVAKSARTAYPGLRIDEAGDVSVNKAVNDRVGKDLGSAELISLPITLVIMVIVFAALIAAGLPVVLAITSVFATMGLMGPISLIIPMEPTVSSMILLIGMAVGVDYSLFYLKRERAERDKGATRADAIRVAGETSGHSIVVSGLAVAISMGGLYAARDTTFDSLGTGALLVVVIAVLGSLTVLPAMLTLLGKWVDRPRIPLWWRVSRRIPTGAVSGRLLRPVLRRPAAALICGGAVMVALAAPALGMRLQTDSLEALPHSITQVRTMQQIQAKYPSHGNLARVVVSGADAGSTAQAVERRAAATGDWSPAGVVVSVDRRTAVATVATSAAQGSSRAGEQVLRLRETVVPQAVRPTGATWAVGGDVAQSYDTIRHADIALWRVLIVVLGLVLVMMGVVFRNAVLAVLTTALNLVSVGAAFGVVTLVFQRGWGAGPLDFHSTGGIITWIPTFLLAVLTGLSMDYHVFVLSRVREHVRAGVPVRIAVRLGLEQTAGVVTSAAVVMVSVFSVFAFSGLVEMKEIGVGLSVAILVDATIVRLVLLPAALCLLGERAWSRGDRRTGQRDPAAATPVLVR
ncbi:MMPL family transporter [Allobranchiibius huperziae]|uniref:RND superfamily putative drug exporter n=1 Tax=Allobranchiibius huperziae TaxID=1874116 RepID=A0A853DHS5_9MICO|nr:MMPL family transporter [Allobranchiibius huperziae]NYJ75573.1 RND superfamily putative drug exporter [Allobranchiibius huperziae]